VRIDAASAALRFLLADDPGAGNREPRIASREVELFHAGSVAYGIVQALAWVAARRPDVAERLQWRSEIQRLMNELVNPAASA
jgi:hypothetical protein